MSSRPEGGAERSETCAALEPSSGRRARPRPITVGPAPAKARPALTSPAPPVAARVRVGCSR